LSRSLTAQGIDTPRDATPHALRAHLEELRAKGNCSGTVFRTSIRATDGTFKILSGEPTVYVKTAESGSKRAQAFFKVSNVKMNKFDAAESNDQVCAPAAWGDVTCAPGTRSRCKRSPPSP